MNSIRFTFSSLGMSRKLVIIFVFMLIIPITISAIVSYNYYRKSIEQNTADYVSQTSLEVLNRIEDYIEDMRMITKILIHELAERSEDYQLYAGFYVDVEVHGFYDGYHRKAAEEHERTGA